MNDTNLRTSVDGKNYTNPDFIKKRERRQYAVDLATEHPDWNIPQLLAAHHLRFPGYTETALRLALKGAGIQRRKPRTKVDRSEPNAAQKPKAVIRASVHSYHGRSRLSAGYVEL